MAEEHPPSPTLEDSFSLWRLRIKSAMTAKKEYQPPIQKENKHVQ